MSKAKAIGVAIIALIVVAAIASASVQIVDAGHRGVLLHWNAVDVASPPLDEGLHFVVPFQDQVVNMEVRTLLYVKGTSAATEMLVLGELNRGAKTFEKILRNTGLEHEALNSILEDLEKSGMMEVVKKQGLMGPKVELQVTEKGFKEFHAQGY